MCAWRVFVVFLTLMAVGCQNAPPPVSPEHLSPYTDPRQVSGSGIPDVVHATSQLPPLHPQEERYTVVVLDIPVKELLFTLARRSQISIDIHPAIEGNVTLNAVEQTLPAILETLSRQVDMVYEQRGHGWVIQPDYPYWHAYKVDYLNLKRESTGDINLSMQNAVENGISTSGGAAITAKFEMDFWEPISSGIKTIIKVDNSERVKRRTRDLGDLKNGQDKGSGSKGEQKKAKEGGKEPETDKLNEESYVIHKATGVLSVFATKGQHKQIQEFLDRIVAAASQQVLIEATVVEVRLNEENAHGVDWSRIVGGESGTNIAIGNLPVFALSGSESAEINHTAKFGSDHRNTIAASIKLLNTFGNASVLSSPKIMAMNNQTAVMRVVNQLVYFEISRTTRETPTMNIIVTKTDATPKSIFEGLMLSVTPNIGDNGVVSLHVRPTLSQKLGEATDPSTDDFGNNLNNKIPQLQVREFDSILRIPSGQVVILGGLMKDSSENWKSGLPGLGAIPLASHLFGVQGRATTKTEMAIFIRPTIMTPDSLREYQNRMRFSLEEGVESGAQSGGPSALE